MNYKELIISTSYRCPMPQVVPNTLLYLMCGDFAEYYLVPHLGKSLHIFSIYIHEAKAIHPC